MPSSTSSSNSVRTDPVYERPAPASLGSAALLALLLAVLGLAGWEACWRDFGVTPSIQNSDGLWALQRRRINNGEGNADVFIGSSRTLSDLQLPVWEALSGRTAIQLALEGTSPLRFLEDLADEPDFKGRLLVGVAPGLFFSGYAYRGGALDHFRNETPSQRAGQWISMHLLEPWLAFIDPDFALFAVLKRQNWPQRDGVRAFLDVRKLFVGDARRNNRLWDKLSTDRSYRELAQSIWQQGMDRAKSLPPEVREQHAINRRKQIDRAAVALDKLRARGVPVALVVHPFDGAYTESENAGNPRAEAWQPLLDKTGAPGIHFEDHSQLQGYELPEWSHMTGESADRYSAALYPLVQQAWDSQSASAASAASESAPPEPASPESAPSKPTTSKPAQENAHAPTGSG